MLHKELNNRLELDLRRRSLFTAKRLTAIFIPRSN
jgi:hypothetical protein